MSVLAPPGSRPPHPSPSAVADDSPPARRSSRRGWRDPRLAVGVALVALAVVVGARVVDGRDDTTAVLAAAQPLVAGQRLAADDLTEVEVRFADAADADRYVAAGDLDDAVGDVVVRDVGAGELLPRDAASADGAAQARLPLAVPLGGVPASVAPGSLVDVWATPAQAPDGGAAAPRRLLEAVPVVSLSRSQGLGPEGEVRVVVGVPDGTASSDRAVRGLPGASLLLVHRPDGAQAGEAG